MSSHNFIKLEPVGSKAPTFSAESKSFTFEKLVGHSFGLLCQAQAYPVPLIRLVSNVHKENGFSLTDVCHTRTYDV